MRAISEFRLETWRARTAHIQRRNDCNVVLTHASVYNLCLKSPISGEKV